MSIKLRKPEPGEERLSWAKGIELSVPGPDGLVRGSIDVQFAMPGGHDEFVRDLKAVQDAAADESSSTDAVDAFLRKVVRDVRGFRDDAGKEWPAEDQIEIVCKETSISGQVFAAFARLNLGKPPRRLTLND